MEIVSFLFQAIIRNPLKRAPFRWIEILDSESLSLCVCEWAIGRVKKQESMNVWCPIK